MPAPVAAGQHLPAGRLPGPPGRRASAAARRTARLRASSTAAGPRAVPAGTRGPARACGQRRGAAVDALRQFRRAATFRVAMQDLTGPAAADAGQRPADGRRGTDPRAGAGARLAADRRAIHGEPRCVDAEGPRTARVAIVGYGKLGGMELGYGSDLDLVFLHDSVGERQQTAGAKPVDNEVFFLRLAQRLVHLLTMHTAAGRLYEVDVRLRPSGKGGLAFTQIGPSKTTSGARPGPGNTRRCCTRAGSPGDAAARRRVRPHPPRGADAFGASARRCARTSSPCASACAGALAVARGSSST